MTAPPLTPAPFVQLKRSTAPKALVELTMDGQAVSVPEGTTLLAAARSKTLSARPPTTRRAAPRQSGMVTP